MAGVMVRRLSLVGFIALAALGAWAAFPRDSDAGSPPTVRVGSLSQGIDQVGAVYLEARDMPLPGLGAWTINVSYDGDIVEATACAGLAGGLCNATYDVDTVRAVGATGSSGHTGNTDLAVLSFRCLEPGESALHVTLFVLVDGSTGDPQPIQASTQDGVITCGPASSLLGDVNCDGSVDAIDAALILQFVAGSIHSLPCEQNADVDDDSTTTAIDAALILQYVAGLIPGL
jgi:hypothetical protein